MVVQYVLGPEYERLPGNNELLFPVYVVLFAAGWLVSLAAWNAFEPEQRPETRARDRLLGRVVLPLVAVVVFLRYVPALADWMSSSPEDAGYLAGPTFAWAIAMLDLGVFLPATIATCFGLVRGAPGPTRPSTRSSAGSLSSARQSRPWRSRCTSTTTRTLQAQT